MTTFHRRELLLGTCALGASALTPWAIGCDEDSSSEDVLRGPLWASAEGAGPGSYSLVVAGPDRVHARFESEARGHGMAVDPSRPERVVMFGRRPERSGIIGDIRTGKVVAKFEAAAGHHHCGHGAFSADGSLLFVVEADDATCKSSIAVFDAHSMERQGEMDGYGVGPHQMLLMPDGHTLALANGGLLTEPGGRDPINLETMRSSLVYIDSTTGALVSEHTVPEPKASLRHIAVADDGTLAVCMQVQRAALTDTDPRPLLAVHRPGEALKVFEDGLEIGTAMEDYAASVAICSHARVAAVTSPRGNLIAFWNVDTGALQGMQRFDDVSGAEVTADDGRFVFTGSNGQVRMTDGETLEEQPESRTRFSDVLWDNHLLTIPV